MNSSTLAAPLSAWRVRAVYLGLLLMAICFSAFKVQAQGYPIELIEEYIRGGSSPARIWTRQLSVHGRDFEMNDAAEARLRRANASDEWIATVRRAAFIPKPAIATLPVPPSGTNKPTSAPSAPTREDAEAIPRRYSRAQLWSLYYDRSGYVATYVAQSLLTETGGLVSGQVVTTPQGKLSLQSTPLRRSALSYGLIVGTGAVGGLMIEGMFEPHLLMIKMGAAYEPFLPIGTTHFRVIAGVTPFLGMTRQILGNVSRAPGDTAYSAIELHNNTYGADGRIGLAYHFRAGRWLHAEWLYRYEATYGRDLRVPGEQPITGNIPWSSWGARGGMVRVGLGW